MPAPPLDDTRREAFAQALARGASVREAAQRSGFKGRFAHHRRRASSPPIADRVAEIVKEAEWGGDAELARLFTELVDMAAEARGKENLAAARGFLADAAKLKRDWAELAGPALDDGVIVPPDLSKEEWLATFAPKN